MIEPVDTEFDLDAYLRRLGYGAPLRTDLATLTALHRAHLDAIPFENLEIQMGGAIRLDLATLQAKMIARHRGGYCFEQNTLFAAALRAAGYVPLTCEARVRQGSGSALRPRTHMVLLVPCQERMWLADVGFGGDGILEPLTLDGTPVDQAGHTYRIVSNGTLHLLQRAAGAGWEDLYAFLPEPVHPIDFEVGNWFTSTHPESPFVKNVTAQRLTAGARHIVRNLTYTIMRGGTVQTREITRAELVPLLRVTFGLDIRDDVSFRALDGDSQAERLSQPSRRL